MSSALDIFTKFVNSPGGVLTAGAVLAGIVWKLFERVEAVLTEQTKLEIAVWLVGVKTEKAALRAATASIYPIRAAFSPSYPTFLQMLKWYIINTYLVVGATTVMVLLTSSSFRSQLIDILRTRPILTSAEQIARVLFLIVPMCYISFPDSFYIFHLPLFGDMPTKPGITSRLVSAILRAVFISVAVAVCRGAWFMLAQEASWDVKRLSQVFIYYFNPLRLPTSVAVMLVLPSFAGVTLLVSAFAAVCLVSASRRFDIGFDWFNRKFDIEKKPLQSIGLVAGAIVAVVYWTVAGLSRVL